MVRIHPSRALLGTVIALGIGAAAAAQQALPLPAASPQPAQHMAQSLAQLTPAGLAPQRTTATYEDWVLRCDVQPGPPAQKICDMAQLTQVQGQASPMSRVAIGRPAKAEPVKLLVQLPVNVSLAAGVRIQADDRDAGLLAPFRRCVPAGCFAEVELRDDILRRFRTLSEAAKLTFKDAAEHDTVIPLSFKGFGQAYDALLKP
jgi:invasion protein IalB